jgi:hypothetical protein
MTEAWEEKQKASRVLGAAVAEAEGNPDRHVFALPVMRSAGVTNAEFRAAARYLDEQGWIAEGADDYETFVVTSEGVEFCPLGPTSSTSMSLEEPWVMLYGASC